MMSAFYKGLVRSVLGGTVTGVVFAATIGVVVYYPGAFLAAYEALLCTGFGGAIGVAIYYTFVLPVLERRFG